LIPPLAAIVGGILASRYADFGPADFLIGAGGGFVLSLLCVRRPRLGRICCCTGLFFAAACLGARRRPGPPPRLDAADGESLILGGCVVEPPAIAGTRERFVLELESRASAQVTLYARDDEALPALQYGQKIDLEAKVRRPRNFGNPGAFDYARYLAR